MKAYYKNAWIALACFLAVWGCNKKPTDYRSFLGGQEIVYPGVILNPNVYPGNLRLLLTWMPSSDPSIKKYVVYWNNNADSAIVSAQSHTVTDTVKCLISNLSEYVYTFFVYSYDSTGNRSIPMEIDNARADGPIYRTSLQNRVPNNSNPPILNADGTLSLAFLPPIDTINITTRIQYVNTGGDTVTNYLAPGNNIYPVSAFKAGTRILYQSSYIPKLGAIDTFYTNNPDTIPYVYVMCDKSIFNAVHLPNDMNPYDGNTYEARLWDGNMQPRGYPTIFHSDGSQPLPGTITMDMGKVYSNVGRIEETGRNCCHNPVDFEVWGIADTTGAVSALAPNNAGWKGDVTAKGWTLLNEIVRTDDGVAPFDAFLIDNPPPVRFIIIRVLKTADDPNYVNMSQLTFWNRE
jgi:uncharacterized protein DUF4998